MKTIILDSFSHYQIRQDKDCYYLYRFPEECPGMGDREPYRPEEGVEVDHWAMGEEVQFLSEIVQGNLSQEMPDKISCGDDFIWNLRQYVNDPEE